MSDKFLLNCYLWILCFNMCFNVLGSNEGGKMKLQGLSEKYEEPWNFSWIIPGLLAASSYPHTMEHMHFFTNQNISHLVTLSPDHKPVVTTFPGISWTYIPIEEFQPPSLDDMKQFIALCEEAKENNEAIVVHCRAGRGRTGTMAACYLVRFLNMSPESAITKIRMMRPGSVETYEQERAVSQYRDYLRSVAE